MLTELYNYAVENSLTAVAGYREKTVKYYLTFSDDGKYLGIIPSETKKGYFPDIGAAANGTTKCNYFAEKASYVLLLNEEKNTAIKHKFLLEGLKEGFEFEPLLGVVTDALENESTLATIREDFLRKKYKPGDSLSYEVDGKKLEKSCNIREWWETFRRQFAATHSTLGRCLITGELADPMATVPKVQGLISVGGHTAGDALLCFDKKAFCSYGFEKSENAVVSENAMTTVNAALGKLLAESGKPVCGAKYLHWYKEPLKDDFDLIPPLLSGFEQPVPESEKTSPVSSHEVRTLISSVYSGAKPEQLENRYYIMPVSGVNGRMMIRGYMEGTCSELIDNVQQWFDDLSIVKSNGKGPMKCPKYFVLCIRLMKPQSSNDIKKLLDRLDHELAALSPQILRAAYQGGPVPDAVVPRALMYIRSKMLASDDENSSNSNIPDSYACMLLKVWLIRSRRKEGGNSNMLNEELNKDYEGSAYHIGRLMAVYGEIQTDALGKDLGAGVIQRYYASASSSPSLVIGKLAQLSQHHISKIKNEGTVIRYRKMLDEIYSHLPAELPTTLTLTEQSEFAVGYYQQHAAIYSKRNIKVEDSNTENKDREGE